MYAGDSSAEPQDSQRLCNLAGTESTSPVPANGGASPPDRKYPQVPSALPKPKQAQPLLFLLFRRLDYFPLSHLLHSLLSDYFLLRLSILFIIPLFVFSSLFLFFCTSIASNQILLRLLCLEPLTLFLTADLLPLAVPDSNSPRP